MIDSTSSPVEVAPRRPSNGDRLPSLDGLRAASIGLVLLGHLGGTRGFPSLDFGFGDYARLGVTVFFVISGFLITRLLLSEYEKNGRVSLRLFYARRTLRLFPAAYSFLACILVLQLAGIVHLRARDFWHTATYTVNYLPDAPWPVGHLWSLSVEEQFYLLWPLAFLLLKPKRAIWAVVGVILLGPVARTANRVILSGTPWHDLPMFPMVADSLATGCLLAGTMDWLETREWYLRLFRPAFALGFVGLILLTNRYMGFTLVAIFGTSLINLSTAVLIHRAMYRPHDVVGRLLNWKPIVFMGGLSYSLYLWQQLFLDRHSAAWVSAFPQNLGFAVATALASYLLLEKPLMNLRHRLRAT